MAKPQTGPKHDVPALPEIGSVMEDDKDALFMVHFCTGMPYSSFMMPVTEKLLAAWRSEDTVFDMVEEDLAFVYLAVADAIRDSAVMPAREPANGHFCMVNLSQVIYFTVQPRPQTI